MELLALLAPPLELRHAASSGRLGQPRPLHSLEPELQGLVIVLAGLVLARRSESCNHRVLAIEHVLRLMTAGLALDDEHPSGLAVSLHNEIEHRSPPGGESSAPRWREARRARRHFSAAISSCRTTPWRVLHA